MDAGRRRELIRGLLENHDIRQGIIERWQHLRRYGLVKNPRGYLYTGRRDDGTDEETV